MRQLDGNGEIVLVWLVAFSFHVASVSTARPPPRAPHPFENSSRALGVWGLPLPPEWGPWGPGVVADPLLGPQYPGQGWALREYLWENPESLFPHLWSGTLKQHDLPGCPARVRGLPEMGGDGGFCSRVPRNACRLEDGPGHFPALGMPPLQPVVQDGTPQPLPGQPPAPPTTQPAAACSRPDSRGIK